MANNIPEFKTPDDLIRAWFNNEEQEFDNTHDDLTLLVREWVFSAYLQGHEDGYTQGESEGYEGGREDGHQEGYDEGYDDATAEYESYD